jgi:hypothetical protein
MSHDHSTKKTSLMYDSKGDTLMTHSQLNKLKTPPPMGARHAPYGFGEYVTAVKEALEQQGITVEAEEFAVRNDQMQMFGVMEIAIKGMTHDLFRRVLGLRGSHDQSIPRGLAMGESVFVCSNLAFHGNLLTISSKQTTNIAERMPMLIRDAVHQIPEIAEKQNLRCDAYRECEITAEVGDAHLVSMYRAGGLGVSNLTKAIQEWHEPSHDEHAENGWSAWRLYNACTESLKPSGNRGNMMTVEHHSNLINRYIETEVVKLEA